MLDKYKWFAKLGADDDNGNPEVIRFYWSHVIGDSAHKTLKESAHRSLPMMLQAEYGAPQGRCVWQSVEPQIIVYVDTVAEYRSQAKINLDQKYKNDLPYTPATATERNNKQTDLDNSTTKAAIDAVSYTVGG